MVRLRQVDRPADKASWTEHFYSGELRVINGVTETDNPEWILQLQTQGYQIIEDEGHDDHEASSVETDTNDTGESEEAPSDEVVVEDTTATESDATPQTKPATRSRSRNK